MPARAIVIIAATTLLTACLNSERLRSNLGSPVAAANAKAARAMAPEQGTDRKPAPATLNVPH